MLRWIPGLLGIALIFALACGCERRIFLSEPDYGSAVNTLSNALERDPTAGVTPISGRIEAPAVVDYPDRPPHYLTLNEAIAMALENGTASSNNTGDGATPGQGGIVDNNLASTRNGPINRQTDRIRVLAFDPAIAATNVEASLSRFDAKWITSMGWGAINNFNNTALGGGNFGNGQNGQVAQFSTSIVKAMAAGGVANITFGNAIGPGTDGLGGSPSQTTYTLLTNANGVARVNPLYNLPLEFGFEQPLLRDFGVGINQLLNQVAPISGLTMPGPAAAFFNANSRLPLTQGPNFTGLPVSGILLARLQFDQSRAEFERQIHHLLLNTEIAYWKLYQAYGQLYSFEEVLRLAHKAWTIGQARFGEDLPAGQFHPIRAQYEEFRGERLRALGAVLEAERELRGIIGLPIEDGMRVVPITPPTMAPYVPNWSAALDDALALRPELVLARENLKSAQFNLMVQKNFLRPDLRFVGLWQPVGFGSTLTGGGTLLDGTNTLRPRNAFTSLFNGNFSDWSVGLTLNVPLGYRLEHATVRAARLGLAQSYYVLEDEEERVERVLVLGYQKLNEWYRRIETARAEHKAYAQAVKAQWELFNVGTGKDTRINIVLGLLDFQRRLAQAQVKEFEAIAEYNNSLVRFEFDKGTIMDHDNVSIAEGPLPEAVQVKAVDNERKRTEALVLNERNGVPAPLDQPGMLAGQGLPGDLETPPTGLPGANAPGAPAGVAPGDIEGPPPRPLEGPGLPPKDIEGPPPRPLEGDKSPSTNSRTEISGSKDSNTGLPGVRDQLDILPAPFTGSMPVLPMSNPGPSQPGAIPGAAGTPGANGRTGEVDAPGAPGPLNLSGPGLSSLDSTSSPPPFPGPGSMPAPIPAIPPLPR